MVCCFSFQTLVSHANFSLFWLVVDYELYHCSWSVRVGRSLRVLVLCLPQTRCKLQICFLHLLVLNLFCPLWAIDAVLIVCVLVIGGSTRFSSVTVSKLSGNLSSVARQVSWHLIILLHPLNILFRTYQQLHAYSTFCH